MILVIFSIFILKKDQTENKKNEKFSSQLFNPIVGNFTVLKDQLKNNLDFFLLDNKSYFRTFKNLTFYEYINIYPLVLLN